MEAEEEGVPTPPPLSKIHSAFLCAHGSSQLSLFLDILLLCVFGFFRAEPRPLLPAKHCSFFNIGFCILCGAFLDPFTPIPSLVLPAIHVSTSFQRHRCNEAYVLDPSLLPHVHMCTQDFFQLWVYGDSFQEAVSKANEERGVGRQLFKPPSLGDLLHSNQYLRRWLQGSNEIYIENTQWWLDIRIAQLVWLVNSQLFTSF